MNMRFLVRGSKAEGWVTLQMEKGPDDLEFEYVVLALDVTGHQRVYIQGPSGGLVKKSSPGKLLGIKLW
jgi:import inner membrane translocase subunit TIM21